MGLCLMLLACNEYGIKHPDSEVVTPVEVTEHFEQAALPGLDVLFVVDGTGSMAEEQAQMGAAAAAFLDGLNSLQIAWQIGVVSMDLDDAGVLQGRPWIISPSTPHPENVLAQSLRVGTDHLPPAAGFQAAMLALSSDNVSNLGFRRPDSALHVIFLSDGDDQSTAGSKESFLADLSTISAESGHSAKASSVVGDDPSGCESSFGHATAGTAFVAVAEESGGIFQSICSADYHPVAVALGQQGVEWQTRYTLQEVPDAGSVRVTVDGVRVTDWKLDEATLVFDSPPAAGADIAVRYTLGAG